MRFSQLCYTRDMPPRISKADRRLIAAYNEAALRIKREIDAVGANPKRKLLLARIDPILGQLQRMTKEYVQAELPEHFRSGSAEAVQGLKKLAGFGEVDGEFSQLHKEALQEIADDASESFGEGLRSVRRGVEKAITRAEKQRVIGEILVQEVQGAANPAKAVKNSNCKSQEVGK